MTPSLQSATVGTLIVLMMLAVGLRVTAGALAAVVRRRALVARVVVVNVVGIPLLGLGIAKLLAVPPPVAAAMLLCAAAPGGPLGPILAGLADADLALATGLMVVLAVLSVVTTPMVAALAVPELDGVRIEMFPVLTTVVAFQLVPLGLGMTIRGAAPRRASRLAAPAATAANGLLAALVIGLVVTRASVLTELGLQSVAAMTTFVGATVLAGDRLARARAERRAVALSTGVRNLALALLLADTYLASPAVDAALLSFGVVMLGLPTLAALRWRRPSVGLAISEATR